MKKILHSVIYNKAVKTVSMKKMDGYRLTLIPPSVFVLGSHPESIE